MTSTRLPDAEHRALITSALDQTLFVEAGAGTGKTTALVGRIVALIRSGVPIERLAAITFTEKAAAELAERARKELEKAAHGHEDYPGIPLDEQHLCRAAIRDLDSAALQTLHSFARKILALYPLEAQLPPDVQVLDDVEGLIDFRERWRAFMEGLFSEESPLRDPLLIGMALNLRPKDLERLGLKFHDNWDRLLDVEFEAVPSAPLSVSAVFDPLAEAMARRSECFNEDDKLLQHLDGLEGVMAALTLLQGADQLSIARVFLGLPGVSRGSGRHGQAKNWRRGVEPIRELLRKSDAAVAEQIAAARRSVLCALLPHIRQFVLDYASDRRTEGRIGFQDMLVFAVELLRQQPSVRRALHERYTHILIDEFQDTDPLQVELAALLAGHPDAAPGPWDATVVEPGRVFFVGDPKQSIYRFRRADIGLFNKTRGAFGSRHVELLTNFRSTPVILDWVNGVFERLFEFDRGNLQQAEWRSLQAPGAAGKQKPLRVRVMGGPLDLNAEDIRREEAEKIAGAIQHARDGLGYRLSDMAILLPQRTNAPAIERALSDAGIPFRVESRSRLFATQDIRDLINILASIDDPTDEVALVAALRSAAFACSDPDLLQHVEAGGRWDYRSPAPAESAESVRVAFAGLNHFHQRRWHLGIGALVEEVIAGRHLLELSLASLRHRESWRRLRFVAEQARSLEGSGVLTTLRQFVEWLRVQVQERAMVQEGAVVEPDDDAVRILTIHAAKGLEFDVVFLGGLGVIPWDNRGDVVIWPERAESDKRVEARIGVLYNYFQTTGYDEARLRESRQQRLERDRLLYVAATRARKLLVVSLFRKAQKDEHGPRHEAEKCASAECIAWACEAAGQEGVTWDWYTPEMPFSPGIQQPPPLDDSPEKREQWLAGRAELFERMAKAPTTSATTIAHAEDEEDEDPGGEQSREPWRKGRAGTSVGRAVHAVLQSIDLATGEGIDAAAASQSVAEGVADQASRIVRLVNSARESAAVQEALRSGRYWREVYVGAEVGGMVVEGFIDLLYESADGYVIVDYKTDSARDAAAIDRAMERYRIQGAVYALVLERALGRSVDRVVFVFTEPRTERLVPDLAAAKEAAVASIEARVTRAAGAI